VTYGTYERQQFHPALTPTPPPLALVFEHQPVRVFVEYNDGRGTYTVDVEDAEGREVTRLFEGEVTRSREDWVDWDLSDDGGRRAPPGTYQMAVKKGGRELKRIWLVIR